MLLTKENIKNNVIKNTAGIYYIKNKLNNKYYIGQSINMYKRLLFHINKSKDANYQHIHRAINKDGIENFEFAIIAYIILDNKNEIKNKLDFLEKFYIKKYKCFGKDGYNATVGGDKGVLALIQTPEVRQRISEASIQKMHKKYNADCWCYNLDTKEIYYINHIYEIENIIKLPIRRSDVLHFIQLNKCNSIHRFIFADTKENLKNKIYYLNNKKYVSQLTDEQRQKQRIGLAKYIYCQYDLNMNLVSKFYLNDVIINFSKQLLYILRDQQCEKPKLINNYYWVKKQIKK